MYSLLAWKVIYFCILIVWGIGWQYITLNRLHGETRNTMGYHTLRLWKVFADEIVGAVSGVPLDC